MPRKSLIRSSVHPYHITARCNNRESYYCGDVAAWAILTNHLQEISILFDAQIHAFVMMPNHFHLLLTTPAESLDVVMHRFMLLVTRTMNLETGRSGKVFGSRYHWTLVDSIHYYDHVTKYIYRNPVKAGLVEKVEEYSYSSLKSVLGEERPHFRLSPMYGNSVLIPELNLDGFKEWLNMPFYHEQELAIKKGLRLTQFSPSKKVYFHTDFKQWE